MVHVDSGVIIPPGSDAVLDPNTNTYIPGPETGKIASDGSYIPPKGVEITSDGKVLVLVTNDAGVQKVVEVLPPPPVLQKTSFTNAVLPPPGSGAPVPGNTTSLNDPSLKPVSGGINTVNDAVQQLNNGPKNRTINVTAP